MPTSGERDVDWREPRSAGARAGPRGAKHDPARTARGGAMVDGGVFGVDMCGFDMSSGPELFRGSGDCDRREWKVRTVVGWPGYR